MLPHNPHTFPQCSLLLRQIRHWNITCLCKLAATETGFSALPGVLGEHGYMSVYFLKMSSFYSSMAHIVPLHHWKFSTKYNKKSDLTLHCHLWRCRIPCFHKNRKPPKHRRINHSCWQMTVLWSVPTLEGDINFLQLLHNWFMTVFLVSALTDRF